MLRNTFLNAQIGTMSNLGLGSMVQNYSRQRVLKWRDYIVVNDQNKNQKSNRYNGGRYELAQMTEQHRDLINLAAIKP